MSKATSPASKVDKNEEPSTEVDVQPESRYFSREELSGIESFEDAMRLATSAHGTVVNAHESLELGDGFKIADEEDKGRLIGVPLMLLEWSFRDGDFGDYVSIRAISQGEDGKTTKWILNDGSTGIKEDLEDFTKKTGRTGGLFVRNGLRVSRYHIDAKTREPLSKAEYRDAVADGRKVVPAATFYLDASA
jgi:hypothetical protein